ncbi:MAG: acyl-CoA thioesterase [Candidatus Omnitrophica bacterium]|nr:acyl-CoA thioesterase [Candidatus Omnitrophota bacterium]
MFQYKTQIFLHHTDAAGRLFFGNQFYLIHEAFETFLEHIGFSIADMMNDPEFTFPLVHAESDYKSILIAGDRITISVAVEKIGDSSVTICYEIRKADGTLAGTAKTVSVMVRLATGLKAHIPDEWRKKFKITN